MSSPYYQLGNTVKLTAEFKNWDGTAVDPAIIKLIIYDNSYRKLEEITGNQIYKLGIGRYCCDYTPRQEGAFYYEWYGEIDGLPSLKRNSLVVRMV